MGEGYDVNSLTGCRIDNTETIIARERSSLRLDNEVRFVASNM